MPNLNLINRTIPRGIAGPPGCLPATAQRYLRFKDFERRYGVSRSKGYLLVGRGLIRAVKLDGATLIDLESADAFFAALPQAEIQPQTEKAARLGESFIPAAGPDRQSGKRRAAQ